jgi:hypothetical protein
LEEVHAGRIAFRPSKTADKTERDRIARDVEHDWNRCGRTLCSECGRGRVCDDDGHLPVNQFRCHRRESIVLTLGPAVFDRDRTPLDVACFGQSLAE